MALPIVKIFNAIKNDYKDVKLEQGYIDLILNKSLGISLTLFDEYMSLYINGNSIDIQYTDEDDLKEIQDDISNTIVFFAKFIQLILNYAKNSKL